MPSTVEAATSAVLPFLTGRRAAVGSAREPPGVSRWLTFARLSLLPLEPQKCTAEILTARLLPCAHISYDERVINRWQVPLAIDFWRSLSEHAVGIWRLVPHVEAIPTNRLFRMPNLAPPAPTATPGAVRIDPSIVTVPTPHTCLPALATGPSGCSVAQVRLRHVPNAISCRQSPEEPAPGTGAGTRLPCQHVLGGVSRDARGQSDRPAT